MKNLFLFFAVLFFHIFSLAAPSKSHVIADPELLEKVGAKVLYQESGAALALITQKQEHQLSKINHQRKRCGGFEKLQVPNHFSSRNYADLFKHLRARQAKESLFAKKQFALIGLPKPEVVAAVDQVSEANLRSHVTWLSSFPTRYHGERTANEHVQQLKTKIETMVRDSGRKGITVNMIDHQSTRQRTLQLVLPGQTRPNEILVFGAHLDSINQGIFGSKKAPGADDDASGSANLIEALRVLLSQKPIDRTIEFFWYAGEEAGLLGSSEIAQTYQQQQKDVVGVLQLDMTLHPGEGELVIGSMTDFTSKFMREILVGLNDAYLKGKIVEDRCGYGCSDHASWSRQGFPALMPFEAVMSTMNHDIHTENDVIGARSSFRHSAIFSKLAISLAMELGNSTWRE